VNRHRTDLVALMFGLAFAAIGGAFLTYELTGDRIDPAWIAGAGLIVLGAVALAVTLGRRMHLDAAPTIEESPDA
jgi:ABC-type uncharacterized transport system permease subunit